MEINNKLVEFIPVKDILITDRARKEFTSEGLTKLSEAICTNIGLLHPIIILKNNSLLTGERRLRTITMLHESGTPINFVGEQIPLNTIPAIRVEDEFDALDLLIAEDVENSARENFTWQEQAAIVANIARLKQAKINIQKEKEHKQEQEQEQDDIEYDEDGEPIIEKKRPSLNHMLDIMTHPEKIKISTEAAKAVSVDLYGRSDAGYLQNVQANLKLDEAMKNPELAEKLNKAPTQKEALKLLQVEERKEIQGRIAHAQGKELRGDRHTLINGDSLVELKKIPSGSINICLTDPIYGINAHKFGVAKRDTGFHDYEDTPERFEAIMPEILHEVSRILRNEAHLYLFCDLSKFYQLKKWIEDSGTAANPWKVQSFPLHWIKVNGARCPHPGFTFRKTVEYIIFAYRGGKQSHHQLDSHWEVSTKRTEVHGAAKEPEGLKILLNNSCYPGDTVLDFMAGSGSTIVACHDLKLKCTAIEIDKVAYGRMVERTKQLGK